VIPDVPGELREVDAIREGEARPRPVRECLEALDAGNPVHPREARYISSTDPAAAWNVKEGRGKFGYFLQATEDFQHSRSLREKVEMLFAHMKQQFRFTRLKLRCLAKAADEFLLVATVQNLRRLVRLRPPTIPTTSCLSTT